MNKIKQLIDWWIAEGKSSNDIEGLLQKQGELAGFSFHLAEYVGTKHSEYIILEQTRKVEYNSKIDELVSGGATKGASEVKAFLLTAHVRMDEKKAEMLYQESKLQLQQVNKVIDAIMMRISYLKKEVEQSRNMV